MAGTRKFRMSERAQARRERGWGERGWREGAIMTDEDRENIAVFSEKVKEAIALLREEIAAINDGKLAIVGEVYEKKAAILKWLELKTPLIEPFLKQDVENRQKLRSDLIELKETVDTNSDLLSRMATAARTVVREIEKASTRNGLGGLYGQDGKTRDAATGTQMKIDQQF